METIEFSTLSTGFSTEVFHSPERVWKNTGGLHNIFGTWEPFSTFWVNGHFAIVKIFVKNEGLDKPAKTGAEGKTFLVKIFFKKGLILERFSVIILDCMKYRREEV